MFPPNNKYLITWQRLRGTTTNQRISYTQISATSISTTLQVAQATTSPTVNYRTQFTSTEESPAKQFCRKGLRHFFTNTRNKSGN